MSIVAGSDATPLSAFWSALDKGIEVHPNTSTLLEKEAEVVRRVALSDQPAYGINTGLGSNLGYRLDPQEIATFQVQLVRERAVAVGDPLPSDTGRAVLLARILTAARGKTGMSPALFEHLCDAYQAGLSPLIPRHGSLGASDLTQTACWALGILGDELGKVSHNGKIVPAPKAFRSIGLSPPSLGPKDGLLLASQTGLTSAVSAQALRHARSSLDLARRAAALSMAGFAANLDILRSDVAQLSPSVQQAKIAKWFRQTLDGCSHTPARIQDALSFRTLVGVFSAAESSMSAAVNAWETSFNSVSDSPAVINSKLVSTAHFQSPDLALALEQLSLSIAMLSHGASQHIQKLMMPELSGLPRFLAQAGGAQAGLVPIQKTVAALLADVRTRAQPVMFDPVPVSEAVEDMAPMTPQTASKLIEQSQSFDLLCAIEAMVAATAIDLRGTDQMSDAIRSLHTKIKQTDGLSAESIPQTLALLQDMEPLQSPL